MVSTEVSGLLHGSGDTHGTSESCGVIAGSDYYMTQGKPLPTLFSNTKNCPDFFIILL
jgi:hypothetical protein